MACTLPPVKQLWPLTLVLIAAAAVALPAGALAGQPSQPASPVAGTLTAGDVHSCVVLAAGTRCWGFGGNGRLGYGNPTSIGDDETPGSAGPVDVGVGRTVKIVTAGDNHTCALLDNGTVLCWGFGGNGRLGYGNTHDIGDNEKPEFAGAVSLGGTAISISAGEAHTCAVLAGGAVRCWGYGRAGQLGNGDIRDIGDDELPSSVAPVDLGGAKAVSVTAGDSHSCVLLDTGGVRCWGFAGYGQLGLGSVPPGENPIIGDNESPASVGPVDLGAGRTASAISAGGLHTCAVLDNEDVRCWGFAGNGQLGYGNISNVGDNEAPAAVAPVDLGPSANVTTVSAGRAHTCARLETGSAYCWGDNAFSQLGYPGLGNVGDNETPASAGPLDLGADRTAVTLATGERHNCALLDNGSVRCWGFGSNGRLGYCNELTVGDDEVPGAAGPVDLTATGAGCTAAVAPPPPPPPIGGGAPPPPAPPALPAPPAGARPEIDPRARQADRARRLRTCLRAAARRRGALRAGARRACLLRHARRPGRVTRVAARALSRTRVQLTFDAPGTDGRMAPAARAFVIRQSLRPLRSARDIARAPSLCRGSCRFAAADVGGRMTLTITGLRPRTTYYYAVAARDNVSNVQGPRSATVRVRTR